MHCGVYHGEKADQQAKRILILAESHHTSSRREADTIAGVPASYSTADVIEHDYIRQDGDPADYRNYRIFSKIINSFGLPADTIEQRRYFFQRVYFGNYIPVLCGVGNNTAKKTIQRSGNRQEYNDQLFRFVNDHQIDVVCCFSRLVYDNLPGVEKGSLESVLQVECEKCGGKRDYIAICKYHASLCHTATNIPLLKDLTVYGMRHPSARCGFCPGNYGPMLNSVLEPR